MFVKKGDYTIILFKMLNVGYCTYVSESNNIDLVFSHVPHNWYRKQFINSQSGEFDDIILSDLCNILYSWDTVTSQYCNPLTYLMTSVRCTYVELITMVLEDWLHQRSNSVDIGHHTLSACNKSLKQAIVFTCYH